MHDQKQVPTIPRADRRRFTSQAQLAFRRGARRRMLWAGVAAVAALVLLVLLGPSQEEVKKRFEYYGAPGELQIMPEIAIEDGQDKVRQIPKTLQTPPPPANIEVEPEDPDALADKPRPRETVNLEQETQDWPTTDPNPNAESLDQSQVELQLPRQSNPDWYILHQVLPEYPFMAPDSEQRIPVIQVRAAIFVDKEGKVSEALIQSANAGSDFTNEVLAAVKQWEFGWRVDPLAGRWIELTFNFNSPYGSHNRG